MTAVRIKYFTGFALYIISCAAVILLQSTGLMTLRIWTASPVLILPLVVYSGMYFGEYGGAVLGFLAGAATDTYSSTLALNTVVLTVCGFAAGLIISRLFNRNFAAAAVLNVCASVLYFLIKWLFLYAFSDPSCGFVFTRFTLPSAVYTAVVGVLLFFILNPILKRIAVRPDKR